MALAAALATAADNAGYSRRVYRTGQGCQPLAQGAGPPAAWDGLTMDSAESPAESLRTLPPAWRPHGIRVLVSDLLWLGDPLELLTDMTDRGLGGLRAPSAGRRGRRARRSAATPGWWTARPASPRNCFSTPRPWPATAGTSNGTASIGTGRSGKSAACLVQLVAERLVAGWDLSALVEAEILTV